MIWLKFLDYFIKTFMMNNSHTTPTKVLRNENNFQFLIQTFSYLFCKYYQLWHNFCLRRHLESFDLTHRLQILRFILSKYKNMCFMWDNLKNSSTAWCSFLLISHFYCAENRNMLQKTIYCDQITFFTLNDIKPF